METTALPDALAHRRKQPLAGTTEERRVQEGAQVVDRQHWSGRRRQNIGVEGEREVGDIARWEALALAEDDHGVGFDAKHIDAVPARHRALHPRPHGEWEDVNAGRFAVPPQ